MKVPTRFARITLILILILFSLPLVAGATEEPSTVTIAGTVTDPDGAPVSGAKVWIVRVNLPELLWERTTGEDGRFEAKGLPGESSFFVRLLADGYCPVNLKAVKPDEDQEVILEKGISYRVKVLDGDTGKPVPEAWVRVYDNFSSELGPEAAVTARADEEGIVRFTDLPEGKNRLYAVSPSHARTDWHVNLPLEDPEEAKLREIFLKPGGHLEGRISDDSGKPVARATLTMFPRTLDTRQMGRRSRGGYQRSGTDGGFLFEGLPSGKAYALHITARGFADLLLDMPEIRTGKTIKDKEIKLTKGAAVTVRLVDRDGNPIPGIERARMEITGGSPMNPLFGRMGYLNRDQILSGDDGLHTLRNLTPGRYTMRLTPRGCPEIRREGLVLKEGKTLDLGEIVVEEGRRIHGTVSDKQGKPVEEASVSAGWSGPGGYGSRSTRSGEDGTWEITGLPDVPSIDLTVAANDFDPAEMEDLPLNEDPVDVVLQRTGGIRGTAATEDGGEIADFSVEAYQVEADVPMPMKLAAGMSDRRQDFPADAAGEFELTRLGPGEYTIRVRARGYAPATKKGIEVRSSGMTDAGTVRLQPGLVLEGVVVRASDGAPVPDAGVSVKPPMFMGVVPGADALNDVVTDGDGRFRMDSLAAGSYNLQVDHVNYSAYEEMITLKEGEQAPSITVELTAGGTIEGTVRDGAGLPVSGAQVMLARNLFMKDARTSTTDGEGRYRFEKLAAGAWMLMMIHGDSADILGAKRKNATVREDEVTVVDFDEDSPIRLGGQVLRGGRPLPEAKMIFVLKSTAMTGQPDFKMTTSDAEGTYSVGLDEPGIYTVSVMKPNIAQGQIGSVDLEVPREPEVRRDVSLAGLHISGRILDSDGEPVPEAMATAIRDGAAPTDARAGGNAGSGSDGAYRIENLVPGVYTVQAYKEGFVTATQTGITLGDGGPLEGIDIRLERGVPLRGRVVDPGGNDLAGAMVAIVTAGRSGSSIGMPAATGIDGRFVLSVAEGETVGLVAFTAGWAPAVLCDVSVDPSRDEQAVLRVTPGGSLQVRIVDAEGLPQPGLKLVVQGLEFAEITQFSMFMQQPQPTDASGLTTISNLMPGMYTVQVAGKPGTPPATVEIREGEQTPVELVVHGP